MNNKAVIAMSGGVDSSVAAYLMKQRGFDCIGVTMKLFANEDIGISREHSCCSLDDVEDARSVAYSLDMPYYVFNFSDRFETDVIDRFIHAYENGITPNPCIDCNRYLKFDKLYMRAKELDRDYVVTGHYARVEKDENGRFLLKKALDNTKDQSYVLYCLTQEQLRHTIFPLGEMRKSQAREIAESQGFINARKADSQDICFVQNGSYVDFIEQYTGKNYPDGDFLDTNGNIIGRHKGVIRYTVGQRKGLGISAPEPLYVKAVNRVSNTVTLSYNDGLYSSIVKAGDINLISVPEIKGEMRVKAKVRYRHTEQWATVTQNGDTITAVFDEPQRAVTCGQALVLYDGDTVVGGGTIIEVE
jgi:tRNA-specific 2-thiouridylase